MFVVAWLANYNGMASWCWEAAHALHEAGHPVLLVCSDEVTLPGLPSIPIFRFTPPSSKVSPQRSLGKKIYDRLSDLSDRPSDLLPLLHQSLLQNNITPTAYFLNTTSLQNPKISTPQYVVAWACPTSLMAYINKIGLAYGWSLSKSTIRGIFEYLGWWRKDWRAYRDATAVLSVSHRLHKELKEKGIKTYVVHPGTKIVSYNLPTSDADNFDDRSKCKLLIAAYDLEDPRKRVRWMIEALKQSSQYNFSLTLVGIASDSFKEWVLENEFPASFVGYVNRDEVENIMEKHDVFLFGSRFDDWGYVLIEAMGRGLCVVAPDISPFDEIVGDIGVTYPLDSSQIFKMKIDELCKIKLTLKKKQALERADCLFSRNAFSKVLMKVFKESVVL